MTLTNEEREDLEHRVRVLRAKRIATENDAEHDRLGRELDQLCEQLAAPDGFDTYSGFKSIDRLMRQPPR